MKTTGIYRIAASALACMSLVSLAQITAAADEQETLYCVEEGGLTTNPPGCVVVERIEDVPPGAAWIPSHGGLDDPEAIRRFWCLDMPGDPPPVSAVPAECLRFFAAEFGGKYAAALRPAVSAPRDHDLAEPLLDMPGIFAVRTVEHLVLELPAMKLTYSSTPVPFADRRRTGGKSTRP